MIITIILFGISNVYAREIIKTCWVNDEYKGMNVFVFPKDGGKPYGNEVAILLSMTNALNLEIEFIEEKENKDNFNYNCYKRLNDGTIDIMPNQDDIHQDYAGNVPYFKGPKDWGLPGNKHLNFAISKKSKFFSRIEEFKSAILTQKEYNKILHATYTSDDQHDWPSVETHDNVYAKETIKACYKHSVHKGHNFYFFPKDGGEPYGSDVENLLSLSNKLNLKLIIEKDEMNNCFSKLKLGKIDIMLPAWPKKGLTKHYVTFIHYYKWGRRDTYFAISKKSKFANDIEKFKSARLSQEQYKKIYDTKFTSAYQNSWDNNKDQELGKNEEQSLRKGKKEELAKKKKKQELRMKKRMELANKTIQNDLSQIKIEKFKPTGETHSQRFSLIPEKSNSKTIKSCGIQRVGRHPVKTRAVRDDIKYSYLNFPADGGNPYGTLIEILLRLTNKLNLNLVIIKGRSNRECLEKMRTGEIDLMTGLSDNDRRGGGGGGHSDYIKFIPFIDCQSKAFKHLKWKCNGHLNFGLSKKSKFYERMNEFVSASYFIGLPSECLAGGFHEDKCPVILSQYEYYEIITSIYTNGDQHRWAVSNQQLEDDGKKKKDSFTLDAERYTERYTPIFFKISEKMAGEGLSFSTSDRECIVKKIMNDRRSYMKRKLYYETGQWPEDYRGLKEKPSHIELNRANIMEIWVSKYDRLEKLCGNCKEYPKEMLLKPFCTLPHPKDPRVCYDMNENAHGLLSMGSFGEVMKKCTK
jgi:hypothetical protein